MMTEKEIAAINQAESVLDWLDEVFKGKGTLTGRSQRMGDWKTARRLVREALFDLRAVLKDCVVPTPGAPQ